ncbi:MAG: histidinol-phosphatase HisJ family protein [Acutalibacteraceae bacterium]|nr:histidinol-phosphatase HisJ family protein [Acutalibacteraceae bacterium]
MKYLQNLHTHSTFCDGKNTPRETVESAISQGFKSIGFSGHSYMHYDTDYCMTKTGTKEYIAEINSLKKEYADKIEIFLGIEADMYSAPDLPQEFDYKIGSLHFLLINGEYVEIDRPAEDVKKVIDEYFGGDGLLYAKKYYEELSKLPTYDNFDIIGHFDLITKHCDTHNFFDMNSKEYLSYAFDCAKKLSGKIPFFEVNTGAIARGYRKTPYPSVPIIKEMKRLGFGAVISSDCHDAKDLTCCFKDAEELLKFCGYKEHYVLTKEGFKAVEF